MIAALPSAPSLNATKSMLLIGVNDILADTSAATIIANLQTIRALLPDVRQATIPPFGGYVGWTSGREAVRVEVNNWIKTTPNHTDLELVLGDGDPTQPALLAEVDSGDGLHPNHDTGDVLMAAAMYAQSFD